jgi:hypothetical protein
VPVSSYPDLYAPATLAYNTATANSLPALFTNPSSNQTVNPLSTPTIKVYRPSTVITLNFDIASNYVGAQSYIPVLGKTYTTSSATTGYMWYVEYVPNTASQAINFAITNPASGTTIVWDTGSQPAAPTTYAVYHFYTLDGLNVKAKVLVNY